MPNRQSWCHVKEKQPNRAAEVFVFVFAELWCAEGRVGSSVASAGPEEETAGQPAASAGVHHLVSAQRRQPGEKPLSHTNEHFYQFGSFKKYTLHPEKKETNIY